jgi:hypothetical protein
MLTSATSRSIARSLGMRTFRFLPLAAVIVVLGLNTTAAASHRRPCTIPPCWTRVARDPYAVVIRGKGQYPAYHYCLRAHGGFKQLVPLPNGTPPGLLPPQPVSLLQLRGPYVAFAFLFPGTSYTVVLWDLRSSYDNGATLVGNSAQDTPSTILLSPTGVAAWIAIENTRDGAVEVLRAAVSRTFGGGIPPTLDTGAIGGGHVLGDLQLFQCSAGCASGATVVSWTHNGEQRYYTIG